MSIQIAIQHRTKYQFDKPVEVFPHVFRLRPAPHTRTPVLAYSLKIQPENHFINWQQDPFGNYQARVVFQEPAKELDVHVEVLAELKVLNPFDFFVEESAKEYPFEYDSENAKELAPYLETSESGDRLKNWVAKARDKGGDTTIDMLVDINAQLCKEIQYGIRMEPGVQSCEDTLELGKGSCRDTAWLLVQILRHLGLAARFVSGYLVQLVPDVKSLDGPSGPEEDFTDLHAWAEVYLPGAGWVGLDPTSGLFAGEGHIPLACTPHFSSAAPVTGSTGPCEVKFSYSNKVDRVLETPRVSKPYTAQQWEAINQLGNNVDASLEKGDVRLTMGGEPTFVSIDDMEGDEWNTTADSAEKRKLGYNLLKRLNQTFATGGVRLCGEGKWYPGEPLPRWAYTVLWRKDGKPAWTDTDLLADPHESLAKDHTDAQKLGEEVIRVMGLDSRHLRPGFEDVFYYTWKEGTIPVNIDPYKAGTDTPAERRFLASILEKGLDIPAGFALPLHWDEPRECWESSAWELRRPEMFLIPGSSPMGFRLPLESIPWTDPKNRPVQKEKCPMDNSGQGLDEYVGKYDSRFEPKGQHSGYVAHTAMCFEARDGVVRVFMPPVEFIGQYLDLLSAVNTAAKNLGLPVAIEGYAPPHDNRVERISVTPDPGVIEVNVHPSSSWKEACDITTTLYKEAREARLGTEKFMVDGRHTGTGGGCHVTMGGKRPSDSPFLRKPGLLRSLITYWQHHPGLSYLFSGTFIGPTSQAPRVDEGRDEKLYEMEIAFQQLPEETDTPWLADRILRNLLTDLTGNTHRAEFCIDKLYSPDSPSGRLGIVEFRGFEMPPHPEMNLVQALLLRSLVAWFWDKPYKHKLVRWGTELHDRFMLPHFIRNDLRDVVADLQDAGFPFQLEWLEPFFEFRFPHFGTYNRKGIEMELRFAIEPWHVLGEESSSQGTSRYVDSSAERLQLKVRGMVGNRHAVLCNGRRLPLYPTGNKGEYVIGVRYKAWAPHSALHPTIGIQSPLTFDLVDTWNGRSAGGCVYHVSHPGGRGYETIPLNSYEAESRRISRFWQHGHTPKSVIQNQNLDTSTSSYSFEILDPKTDLEIPVEEEPNAEYPVTFDLRNNGNLSTSPSGRQRTEISQGE